MPNLFGAMLQQATAKVYSQDYQDPTVYLIQTQKQDWSLNQGDWVGIVRKGYQPIARRVRHIAMQSDGKMQIEAGKRLRTLAEKIKGQEDTQRILQSFQGAHAPNGFSWPVPGTNIDSFTPISFQFLLASTDDSTKNPNDKTLGSGIIDPNFPYQVLLNTKIDWYNSSLLSGSVPGDSHSNVGNHAGYGGSTSAMTQDGHGVNSVGNQATATAYAIVSGTAWSDDAGSHAHGIVVYGGWTWTSSGKDQSWSPTGSGQIFASGVHYHGINVSLAGIQVGTQYLTPAHSTNAAGPQSHGWGTSANARAGSAAHPDKPLTSDLQRLNFLINHLPTGSMKYLTLDIKVNGVEVPGSPFNGNSGTGLYIKDEISSVDISSLVTIGQKNEITYTVSEFNGSETVKCSISGSVNVSSVISAF